MAECWDSEHGSTVNASLTTTSGLTALNLPTNYKVALVDNKSNVAVKIRFGTSAVTAADLTSTHIPANCAMFVWKGSATHFHAKSESATADISVTCGQFKGE